jgi:hypothetical protein
VFDMPIIIEFLNGSKEFQEFIILFGSYFEFVYLIENI